MEYGRRIWAPLITVRRIKCCPGSKRNAGLIASGTENVTRSASAVSKRTSWTSSEKNLFAGTAGASNCGEVNDILNDQMVPHKRCRCKKLYREENRNDLPIGDQR